jgi:predicted dehydrogenase
MMLSRKQFLQAATAGLTGVNFLPRTVWGANDKLNIAFIGIGGRGEVLILAAETMLQDVNLACFADIDAVRSAKMKEKFPRVPFYSDFREMITQKKRELDGVVIALPDHLHHYAAKFCLSNGLPVYLEKPLAHTIRETKDLMDMEKKTGLACQMGNQGHSSYAPYIVKEWLQRGYLGEVHEAHVWTTHNNYIAMDKEAPKEIVPSTLDWEQWLGPAPYRDYSSQYCPQTWRVWNDFGEGTLGDMGCHCLDVAYFSLGLRYPAEVIAECSQPPYQQSFPECAKIVFRFPKTDIGGPVSLTWYHGPQFPPPRPANFEKDRLLGNEHGGSYLVGSAETVLTGSHGSPALIIPELRRRALREKLEETMNEWKQNMSTKGNHNAYNSSHFGNWLNAIRGKEKCRSHFGYGGCLSHVLLLGVIALRLNTKLRIDPATGEILDNPAAQASALGPEPRTGWRI